LLLIYNNVAMAGLGDASGPQPSAVAGSMYATPHESWPGEGGDQSVGETSYPGYGTGRQAIARSAGGFTVSGRGVSNTALITFPECTSGSAQIWYLSIGDDATGAGALRYIHKLGTSIGCAEVQAGDLAGNTINVLGHGLSAGDRVAFFGTVPTGLTEGVVYWVLAAGLTSDAFTVSTTEGGGAVDITGSGECDAWKMTGLAVSVGIAPKIDLGDLTNNT